MSYFSKQDIKDYLDLEKARLTAIGLTLLNSEDEIRMQLENEQELVTVYWLETEGEKIQMNGKTFFRIDYNLYTDDRFAIDSFIAIKDNITISELINSRNRESKKLKQQNLENIEKIFNILKNTNNGTK